MTQALYRRYRPETFADVIGQEHVTEPLMQALRTGRVNHAYLFSGPRGCGKTTSARILARCLNCEQGPTPEPCGECASCVALARGGPGSVDVIEIDAASHGGVDDARDLREKASYGPAQSRFKIYIIDEAHMVSSQGFNALLKIVEEPPEHVMFVFATTEPEKVIGTIRSRTHHYPFRLVPPQRLHDYMERLCEREGVKVEPGVLSFVTRAGGGSVRDSLSVLDQLIAGSHEGGLTYEGAAALLGFTDGELLDAIIEAFAAGDGAGVFTQVDRVVETGLDPRRFVEDLLERLRDLIVIAAVPEGAASVLRTLPEDQVERMRHQAATFGPGALSRAADIVNTGLTEMTGATSPRLQLELICARVLLPGASGEQGYAARLDRIERRLEVGGTPSGGYGAAGPVSPTHPAAGQPMSTRPGGSEELASGPDRSGPVPAVTRPGPADHGPGGAERPDPQQQRHQAEGRAEHRGEHSVPVDGAPEPVAEHTPRAGHGAPPLEESGGAGDAAAAAAPGAPAGAGEPPATPRASGGAGPGGLDVAAIRRAWPDVLGKVFSMRRATWTFVSQNAQVVEYDGQRLVLGIATVGLANTFRRGPHADIVRQALIDVLGIDARVEGMPTDEAQARLSAPLPPTPVGAGEAGSGSGAQPHDGPGRAHGAPGGGGVPEPSVAAGDPQPDGPQPGGQRGSAGESTPGSARAGAPQSGGDTGTDDDRADDPASLGHPGDARSADAPPGAAGERTEPGAPHTSPSSATPSAGSWADRPAPQDSAPSWANEPPVEADEVAPEFSDADPGPDQVAGPGEGGRGSRLARAQAAIAEEADPGRASTHVVSDDDISDDDEDIEEAGEVGLPVVQRLLGGTVIAEEER